MPACSCFSSCFALRCLRSFVFFATAPFDTTVLDILAVMGDTAFTALLASSDLTCRARLRFLTFRTLRAPDALLKAAKWNGLESRLDAAAMAVGSTIFALATCFL